jgi:Fe2+ transport system protein FeoA
MQKRTNGSESHTLASLAAGSEANVVAVRGDNAVSRRLMEMGVVPGVSVKVIKTAPFGDPMEIRLLGYNLAVRKNEADAIEIEANY